MVIISAAASRATAARALVECAVRTWRLKFPTSKIDDCAVVCLFLDPPSSAHPTQESNPIETPSEQHIEVVSIFAVKEEPNNVETHGLVTEESNDHTSSLEHLNTHHDEDEIVPVSEESIIEKLPWSSNSTRSLAECISATDDEEWSTLEGVTRVNSLVNLPRFLSGDKRSGSRKEWL